MTTDIARPEYEGLVVDYGFESATDNINQGLMRMRMHGGRCSRPHAHFQQRHVRPADEGFDEKDARIGLALNYADSLAVNLSILNVAHRDLANKQETGILHLARTGRCLLRSDELAVRPDAIGGRSAPVTTQASPLCACANFAFHLDEDYMRRRFTGICSDVSLRV
jgi:hypothetical protein